MADKYEQYLDLPGLEYLWDKAVRTFSGKKPGESDQDLLEKQTISGSVQSFVYDANQKMLGMNHKIGDEVIRTDRWSKENGIITEIRTLKNGAKLTIVTDTGTLVTTTTFEEAEGSSDGG